MSETLKRIVNYKTIRVRSNAPDEDRLNTLERKGWKIHSTTQLFYPDGFVTVHVFEREESWTWEQKEVNLLKTSYPEIRELEGQGWIFYARSDDGNAWHFMRQVFDEIEGRVSH